MNAFRHIVLCHGYSLAESNLEGIKDARGKSATGKFGDWWHVCMTCRDEQTLTGPLRILGRIPQALVVADMVDAEHLIFSTGSTWFDSPGNRFSEAEYMYRRALEMASQCVPKRRQNWLSGIALLDEQSIDTRTTMECVAEMIDTTTPLMLHHVTSANHAPRVMRDATVVFGEMPNVTTCVVAASTSYGQKGPRDVVIRELGE